MRTPVRKNTVTPRRYTEICIPTGRIFPQLSQRHAHFRRNRVYVVPGTTRNCPARVRLVQRKMHQSTHISLQHRDIKKKPFRFLGGLTRPRRQCTATICVRDAHAQNTADHRNGHTHTNTNRQAATVRAYEWK